MKRSAFLFRFLMLGSLATLGASCGGASSTASNAAASTTAASAGNGTEQDASWSVRAHRELAGGNLTRAHLAAMNALQLDAHDERAMEVEARVALAQRDPARVILTLGDPSNPELRKLLARAFVMRHDFSRALATLQSVPESADEDWTRSMRLLATSMGDAQAFAVEASSPNSVSAPWRLLSEHATLPVVQIKIDGRDINALVVTASAQMMLDDGLAATPKRIERVQVGDMVVQNVPASVMDLSLFDAQAGAAIGAVIGLDFLFAMNAVLDGVGHALIFQRSPAAAPLTDAPTFAFVTLNGTMLAVTAAAEAAAPGFFLIDTSQPFPVAVTDDTVLNAGKDPRTLAGIQGAPDFVRQWTISELRIGNLGLQDVPALVGVTPNTLATVAHTSIAGVIGYGFFAGLRVTFDVRGKQLILQAEAPAQ